MKLRIQTCAAIAIVRSSSLYRQRQRRRRERWMPSPCSRPLQARGPGPTGSSICDGPAAVYDAVQAIDGRFQALSRRDPGAFGSPIAATAKSRA